ncbi:MAG: hypothetical protein WCE61_19910 [Candidatus Acidiferrum sp.]
MATRKVAGLGVTALAEAAVDVPPDCTLAGVLVDRDDCAEVDCTAAWVELAWVADWTFTDCTEAKPDCTGA